MQSRERKLDTLVDNIRLLEQRREAAVEQKQISCSLLAELVCEETVSAELETVYNEYCSYIGAADAEAKAELCRRISTSPKYSRELERRNVFGIGDAPTAGTHGRTAYVRNRRVDDVFNAFSERVRGLKAYYAASFSEACEAVFSSECEFCILPIESSSDGKLFSFYSMIDRYELKICGIYSAADEQGQTTVYALVGRSAELPRSKAHGLRYEFSVSLERAELLGDVIRAGELLGAELSYIGSQPVPYDDRYRYYLSMDFEGASPVPMALYMSLEYPSYTPLGLYTV